MTTEIAKLTVEKARTYLAQCVKVDEVKKIKDQASAMKLYLRSRQASLEAQNDAAEIALRAERRMGELAPKPSQAGTRSASEFWEEQEIATSTGHRFQKLAAMPQGDFEGHISAVRAKNEKLTTSGTLAAVSGRADHDGDAWGTPADVIEMARLVMGSIDLDPASNAQAQKTVGATEYFTKKDNGLSYEWHGNVWLNPPYSQPLVSDFSNAVIKEYRAKRVKQAIVLVNNATDTGWFHELLEFPVCLTQGRIKFVHPRGGPSSPLQGQAIFYLGSRVKKFADVFGAVGAVVARV